MIFLTSKILKWDRKITSSSNEPEMPFQKSPPGKGILAVGKAEFFQRKIKWAMFRIGMMPSCGNLGTRMLL